MNLQTVVHTIPPLYDSHSRVLLLGSIPSPKSREAGFYYAHPQNRFWRVLAAVLGEPVPQSIEEKRAMCLKHHVALWDTIARCDIAGASDLSIRNAEPNDIGKLVRESEITRIFATGGKSAELYRKLIEPQLHIPITQLPSTSPANAAWSLDRLIEASQAGVQVDMIVRGICCLRPGVPGATENLRVISIVGRFLEHSRIYIFGTEERRQVYISSADLMTRNTLRRVEVAVPIRDPDLRQRLVESFRVMLRDNQQARQLDAGGVYTRVRNGEAPLNSQAYFCRQALEAAAAARQESAEGESSN